MLKFEYEELFKELYEKAEKLYPCVFHTVIYVSTNNVNDSLVQILKGEKENEGHYMICCNAEKSTNEYVNLSFAIGLTMVIYDLTHGKYVFQDLSQEEKQDFYDILDSFYPEAEIVKDIILNGSDVIVNCSE